MSKKRASSSRRGAKAFERGKKLEDRVAAWLTKQGYKCSKRVLARGKIAARPYEVDIYATKGIVFKHHLWVECKAYTIKRVNVHKLIESARDVKDFNNDNSNIQKWAPNMLMLASDKGFDVDAIKLADKYYIYCLQAGKSFEFMGRRKRDNLNEADESKFD